MRSSETGRDIVPGTSSPLPCPVTGAPHSDAARFEDIHNEPDRSPALRPGYGAQGAHKVRRILSSTRSGGAQRAGEEVSIGESTGYYWEFVSDLHAEDALESETEYERENEKQD
jgi:hypothetical protein